MREQRPQPFRLAGRGGRHPQVGRREQRALRDLGQEPRRQVAVQRHRPGPGRGRAAEPPVGQRPQDAIAGGLQRMGVGNGGDQAVRTLDCHVAVGRQIIGAIDVVGDQPQTPRGGDQLLALGVAADGGQDRGPEAEPRQRHRDVHRHAAGQPGDAARHVGPQPHVRGRAADDVPQDGTDAEDVGGFVHAGTVSDHAVSDHASFIAGYGPQRK